MWLSLRIAGQDGRESKVVTKIGRRTTATVQPHPYHCAQHGGEGTNTDLCSRFESHALQCFTWRIGQGPEMGSLG